MPDVHGPNVFIHLHGTRWQRRAPLIHPRAVFWCDAATGVTRELTAKGERRNWLNPLDALHEIHAEVRASSHHVGCCAGFISYDLGHILEPRATANPHGAPRAPLFALAMFDETPIASNSIALPALACAESTRSTFTRGAYIDAVQRVKELIAAGDVFQVNLAQRFTVPLHETVEAVNARLREQSPAHYGALLKFGDLSLISNSPELFLRITPDRRIVTRPIKGTRPRGAGMREALRDSKKDQAELAMIVDLERNDLGRVCEIGSVRVTEPRIIEEHPTVYHGAATIEGTLRNDLDFIDVLRATFPCGSITGAPKIRAMQIIDELEPVSRGPYCGAIGYFASDGSMQFNVAIRTIIVENDRAHVSVGGGIVADSIPADEYDETLVKARAMFAALGVGDGDF